MQKGPIPGRRVPALFANNCRSLKFEARGKGHDAGGQRRVQITQGCRIGNRIGGEVEVDASVDPADFRVIENVVRLCLETDNSLFTAEREYLAERHVEIGVTRERQFSRTASQITQYRRSDQRMVGTGEVYRRHGIGRRIEVHLTVGICGQVCVRITNHVTALAHIGRTGIRVAAAVRAGRPRDEAAAGIERCTALDSRDT